MKYNAYIDESGDEGIRRGTEWLVLTAVIVQADMDLTVSKSIDDIKTKLCIPSHTPFHWKLIRNKHVGKKRFVIDRLAQEDFICINVIANTYDIENISATSTMLYNYFCRILIERITWYISEKEGTVNLIFSNRSNTSWADLKDYISTLCTSRQCEIKKDVICGFEVYDSWQKKMLQFADACASSTGEAFNKDSYGYFDERFILTLSDKLYRRNGKLFSYGLKIFPDKHLERYFTEYKWLASIK